MTTVSYIRLHKKSNCDIMKQSESQTVKSTKYTDCYAKLKIPE